MDSVLYKNIFDTEYQNNRKEFDTPSRKEKVKSLHTINTTHLKKEKREISPKAKKRLDFDDILYCHEDWCEVEKKIEESKRNIKEDYSMNMLLESLSTKYYNTFIRNPHFHTSRG